MSRIMQDVYTHDPVINMVLWASSGSSSTYDDFNFLDGSLSYFGKILKQSFSHTLIDNVGLGELRVCYNRPDYDISSSVVGAKTLKSGDSLYIEEDVWNIRIYYISSSQVELVLKADNDR